MADEYGAMSSNGLTYEHEGPLTLESGEILPHAQLRYNTYGTLNSTSSNVLLINHALTGNSDLASWWGDMLGSGKSFDTDKYFIVSANILGSCYGSTSPTSVNPETGEVYGREFPSVSIRDTVKLQGELLESLGVKSLKSVIGGSFGGMQTLEYLFTGQENGPPTRSSIPIACGSHHTGWQIGISELQRQAIYADPNWKHNPMEAKKGLEVARMIGMISYRTPHAYEEKFGRAVTSESKPYGSDAEWNVKSYLEYQGSKFLTRFDPITYVKLTEQMDSHDLARGRGEMEEVLGRVEVKTMVVGIESDVLYPVEEQRRLSEGISGSELVIVKSDAGHDGFLLEQEEVSKNVTRFLNSFE
ncbi:hypothetical protein TrLO_g3490 [Triparma laevis f. longispina]|uniref:AB hydrolase-1 domain-containing protein n=1 Tax=Triparma laevis f. longispina TaxID=1714387 RepID=A0A9W7AEL8_9STRA|nr:hypothetical protein TrLO_g3490 [Triparma laevis f. longispina]